MKTQVMTFNISNSFEEWANNFDSHWMRFAAELELLPEG